MPTTLYLVRHAQGVHNLSIENEVIPDPNLTDLGRQQCADLRSDFPHHSKITHLIASPLRRTIQTCLEGFSSPDTATRLKVIALPEIQEVSNAPCDTGSEVAVLEREFGERVDLSRLERGWMDKGEGTFYEPKLEALERRAVKARRLLREIGEEAGGDTHMVVVCHGGFLHFLTDDWTGIPAKQGMYVRDGKGPWSMEDG
jgi:broad specificity phosphatase PhoE